MISDAELDSGFDFWRFLIKFEFLAFLNIWQQFDAESKCKFWFCFLLQIQMCPKNEFWWWILHLDVEIESYMKNILKLDSKFAKSYCVWLICNFCFPYNDTRAKWKTTPPKERRRTRTSTAVKHSLSTGTKMAINTKKWKKSFFLKTFFKTRCQIWKPILFCIFVFHFFLFDAIITDSSHLDYINIPEVVPMFYPEDQVL